MKEKFKNDSMLNYTSENFNPITMALQERKKYTNFKKVSAVSAFLDAANSKSANSNKLYQNAMTKDQKVFHRKKGMCSEFSNNIKGHLLST